MSDETDIKAVEAANSGFYTAVESADVDLLGAVWVEGVAAVDAWCVHPGWPSLRGRTDILRSFAVILANTPYIQFFLTDVEVRLAGDLAIVTCAENILTAVDGDDDEGRSGLTGGRVVATNVFRRTSTGWRLWLHHASPVLSGDDDDTDDDADEADA
jgi:ketosteroid isomerase-like protein